MNKYSKFFWCFSLIIYIASCTSLPSTPFPTNEEVTPENFEDDNDLTSSSINTVPPADILQEVSWFLGGGPGGSGPSTCADANSYPFIRYDPQDVELMDYTYMTTCGWQGKQELQANIIFPNGKVQQEIIHAYEDGKAVVSIAPNNSDPEGIYEFTISDGVTVLKSNAYIRRPNVPRMHYSHDNTIRFYNFPPNELVRLFRYKCIYNIGDGIDYCRKSVFIGWQEYQISANGVLEVKIQEIKDVYYVAVTASGIEMGPSEKRLPTTIVSENSQFFKNSWNYWGKSQEYLLCPENSPTIPNDARWGEIANTDSRGIDLYSQPRTSARSINKLQNGAIFSISVGPKCNEGNIFWAIYVLNDQFGNGKYGYVNLADFDGNYYFKPIVVSKNKNIECGSMKSYLSTGDRGKVVSSDSSNLRLRDRPGVDQKIIDLLSEGTLFLVLDGLECIDNTAWWKIHTNTGLEGWVAEYYANEYLLTLIYADSCYDIQELSHLSIGDVVEIATEDGTALRVRSRANLVESDILFSLQSGVEVSIAEGPLCYGENTIWWRIVTKEGNTGWMAEYQDGVYYLKPIQ